MSYYHSANSTVAAASRRLARFSARKVYTYGTCLSHASVRRAGVIGRG